MGVGSGIPPDRPSSLEEPSDGSHLFALRPRLRVPDMSARLPTRVRALRDSRNPPVRWALSNLRGAPPMPARLVASQLLRGLRSAVGRPEPPNNRQPIARRSHVAPSPGHTASALRALKPRAMPGSLHPAREAIERIAERERAGQRAKPEPVGSRSHRPFTRPPTHDTIGGPRH